MIGIGVANVPEGLLPQMTVALSLTARRLFKRGLLVSNLEIIETLGAVTVICSDKTGTLTCNRMSVSHIVYNRTITSTPIAPTQEGDTFKPFDPQDSTFKALQTNASLNTDAIFLFNDDKNASNDDKVTKGDASESAMIKLVEPIRSVAEYRHACPRIFCVPFNSSNKWMLSIHQVENKSALVMAKGAPEKIMDMCSHLLVNGVSKPFTKELREEHEFLNQNLAKRGERVLAFASLELPQSDFPPGFKYAESKGVYNFPIKRLVLTGFMSLVDPPRPGVLESIADCHRAGIQVFMVTGDHPVTAAAIAKSLNLITSRTAAEYSANGEIVPDDVSAIVVHGSEMETFVEADWERVFAHKEIVFARTMPTQKQYIVRELNRRGHVVAMTGDGVNDAPALKAAHVGIAMGSGTAVAREAGQIVLLDDNFANIVLGIREGRLIFDNLKKCIAYVLSSNVAEFLPFLMFVIARVPLAMEVTVVLLIDLGTDLAPAIALAYEEPEEAIMNIPPRKNTDHLVSIRLMLIAYFTIGLFEACGAYFAYFWVFNAFGFPPSSLYGAGLDFRLPYAELDAERKSFFYSMCKANKQYMALDRNCQESFGDFRAHVLSKAQTAFFITVIWGQIGNVLIRKTQIATIFTFKRFFGNKVMAGAVAFEILMIVFCIFVHAVRDVFLFRGVTTEWAAVGLWILPFLILWDETRKFACRCFPKSLFYRYANF